MLEIYLDTAAAVASLARLPAALDRQQPRYLGDIGRTLADRARADYLVKARGGTGQDGTKWDPVQPRWQKRKRQRGELGVGLATADLYHSLTATTDGDSALLGFTDQPKANAFNVQRRLLPETLPPAWTAAGEQILQTTLDQLAATLF